MTSTHQNIINEDNVPVGEIYKEYYWVFPKIIKEIKRGNVNKTNEWVIIVELFDNNKNIKILKKYFNNTLLQEQKYTSIYYTITNDTDGKKTTSQATTILSGKNIGKKNQTNVFTQGLMEARAKYNKKLNESALTSVCDKEKKEIKMYSPMLLHIYDDKKINYSNNIYYIQKKLNGLRALYNNNYMWSRQKKIYPIKNYIMDELEIMLKNKYYINGVEIDNANLYLDGELYKHGINLETINSIARSNNDTKNKIEYHVFDVFYPSIKLTFNERLGLLNTLFQTDKKYKYIKLVETVLIKCEKDIKKLYNHYVKEHNYEGLVLRIGSGLYSLTGSRTHDVLKIKKRMDEDMCLVGYTSGNSGKDKDAIIFVIDAHIKEYKEKVDANTLKKMLSNKTFNVVPNWTLKQRKEMFKAFENDPNLFIDKYYGASIRVEFASYSANNIPMHAKVISILNN